MPASPEWHQIAFDRGVLRRAAITSLGVGTVLSVANHADMIASGQMAEYRLVPIAITYFVPFVVTIASSVIAVRVERRNRAGATRLLEQEIDAINRFPGQNPNPVMRIDSDGRLLYANEASRPIRVELGVEPGETMPAEWTTRFIDGARQEPPEPLEVECDRQTFAVLPVHVPELGVYNLYGTDVTGAKVVERFPDRNPNPVLRLTPDGRLLYANDASGRITRALGIATGDRVPDEVFASLTASLDDPAQPVTEVSGEGRVYRLQPVSIPEFGFVNVYGTDVTSLKAVDKFPDENPNPVLRLDRDGTLTYANTASGPVRRALGVEVGERLEMAAFARIGTALDDPAGRPVEIEADGRVFTLRVVRVFEFDSINLYGTDVTAARQVERLNAENERLLLNILPPSIAARLRGGETVIADRFDDMAVLFADVVGFTEISARLAASDVVRLLNDIFTMCDRLVDRFGLEKVKTVGDAYMVVGGLDQLTPERGDRRVPPATAVAEMGLALLDELEQVRDGSGVDLQVRVGMHVGPAVAGVIGLKKFIYDVWGDTVNTASRMESTGVPGRLQVTRATYERLREGFEFERRGVIEVKGKGRLETWFLVSRRPGVEAVDTVPTRGGSHAARS